MQKEGKHEEFIHGRLGIEGSILLHDVLASSRKDFLAACVEKQAFKIPFSPLYLHHLDSAPSI